jgi:16S rRNA (guanine527-N7)-methyltransferase
MVKAEGDDFIVRHFADSLAGLPTLKALAKGYQDPTVADLGSGAGLPGIPLAIGLPSVRFALIERWRACPVPADGHPGVPFGQRPGGLQAALRGGAQYEIVTCRAFHPFNESEMKSSLS